MDEAPASRLARELADAIAAAVGDNSRVEACRISARAAGFELRVTIEAVVVSADQGTPDVTLSTRPVPPAPQPLIASAAPALGITLADRRFLRSLRIAADDPTLSET